MADTIEQQIAAEEETLKRLESELPSAAPVAVEMVTFRHPLTKDTKTVPADPAQMIPLMGRGYKQVKGA